MIYSPSGRYKLKNMLDWNIIGVIYVYQTNDPKYTDIITDMNNDSDPANDNMYGFGIDTSVNGYWQFILQP